jgi:hypothetical protein
LYAYLTDFGEQLHNNNLRKSSGNELHCSAGAFVFAPDCLCSEQLDHDHLPGTGCHWPDSRSVVYGHCGVCSS